MPILHFLLDVPTRVMLVHARRAHVAHIGLQQLWAHKQKVRYR